MLRAHEYENDQNETYEKCKIVNKMRKQKKKRMKTDTSA